MEKIKVILRGPLLTASGYGVHSRQILDSLLARPDVFDLSVYPISWGNTPFLSDDLDLVEKIKKLAIKFEEERRSGVGYDVTLQVTIPNEFQRCTVHFPCNDEEKRKIQIPCQEAKASIGVTAGIEVDRVSPEWLLKSNKEVDLVLVPSQHSAATFMVNFKSAVDQSELKLEVPLAIAPEGVNTEVFNNNPLTENTFDFSTDFNFLFVGLGLDKGMGEDRKNVSTLIKWFCEKFKDDKEVGLVLKLSLVNNTVLDKEACLRRIKEIKAMTGCGEFPKIHLVHGRLSDEEMAKLYKHPKVKAMISLSHGEGFGLPLLEAVACDLPIMATNWSGHVDFLNVQGKKRFVAFDYDLAEIPQSCVWNGVMEQGSRWANVREEDVKNKMRKLILSYDTPKQWAVELGEHVRKTFNTELTNKYFAEHLVKFFEHVQTSKGNVQQKNNVSKEQFITSLKEQIKNDCNGKKTLLYTMPMSAGDVLISTAVVHELRKKFPEHKIYFASNQQYYELVTDNKDIDSVINWDQWMMDVPLCEEIFDEVYTPNLAVQLNTSNWIHGGKGRRLLEEFMTQCGLSEFKAKYQIPTEEYKDLQIDEFILFNPGSGKGQWEARNYNQWQEVVNNLTTEYKVVQVGLLEDPLYDGVIDLRGKTNYKQLADLVSKSLCVVGIDSVTSHMAAAFNVPQVSLYGSSYATSTGPVYNHKETPHILLETENRLGCEKACYKYQCKQDAENPCINEIPPLKVVNSVLQVLTLSKQPEEKINKVRTSYKTYMPKICSYTTVFNAESNDYPYIESISSMLGFSDEVVVVDGGSKDGTVERIRALGDDRIKVFEKQWDFEEPGIDGQMKAFARAMCDASPNDFLIQADVDEIFHEQDYEKIKALVKRFPKSYKILDLPVVELWGLDGEVRTDRHATKWRIYRNDWEITHGIQKDARIFDPETGKTFSKKGMSDGCFPINAITYEMLPSKSFYTMELEKLRLTNPEAYGKKMNEIFNTVPSSYHASWVDIERKIKHFKSFWNLQWSALYYEDKGKPPVDRFPDVVTEDDIKKKSQEMLLQGGEHGKAVTFRLDRPLPKLLQSWIDKRRNVKSK